MCPNFSRLIIIDFEILKKKTFIFIFWHPWAPNARSKPGILFVRLNTTLVVKFHCLIPHGSRDIYEKLPAIALKISISINFCALPNRPFLKYIFQIEPFETNLFNMDKTCQIGYKSIALFAIGWLPYLLISSAQTPSPFSHKWALSIPLRPFESHTLEVSRSRTGLVIRHSEIWNRSKDSHRFPQ